MASTKIWEQGELRLQDISEPIDYGAAVALTRLGTTGVKVWIRYHREAAAAVQSSKELRLNAPLSQVLMAQRLPLPAS
ncbi:ribosomal_S3_C domain-containing protein [Haematococcus lacustris]|uniref:Ribosomal_S3_C domain-containing protein n=1 Tax=Haematococcus lacustris TaxID=44745 RepID=A0A699Z8T6_HAELA|nr:ribosomal_S3_C domain-containing protein [Haematococcus lacustris]